MSLEILINTSTEHNKQGYKGEREIKHTLRVASATLWKRSFLFSPKNTNFDGHHGREYLCGNSGVQNRVSSTPLQEKPNLSLDTLKRLRGTISLTHTSPPKLGQLIVKRDPSLPELTKETYN